MTIAPAKAGSLPEAGRVAVIGTVLDLDEGMIVLDDGTGSVTGRLSETTIKNGQIDKGVLARVVGRLGSGELDVEIIQNFDGFDTELYEKALEAFRKEVLS